MNTNVYVHDKLKYTKLEINTLADIENMISNFKIVKPKLAGYDTESTGLNTMIDKPFLVVFGYDKFIYYCNNSCDVYNNFINTIFELVIGADILLFAHNAKFDWHMLYNNGTPIPDNVKLADSITLARLTENCDNQFASMKLENLGIKYVDKDAKFASDIINKTKIKLRNERKKEVCNNYKLLTGANKFTDAWEIFTKRVKHITKYHEAFNDYVDPTYYDVYLAEPDLMTNYAVDDVVIMLEVINKIIPIYVNKYSVSGVVNNEVFFRENKLINYIANVERQGFSIDINYLIDSHYKMQEYKDKLYTELHNLTGTNWKVGQHKKIIEYFDTEFNITITSAGKKVINNLMLNDNVNIQEIAKLIGKLRTVDKWLSTYINGILNKSIEKEGKHRLHTTINNNGTVSGRVSSDLQQMPKFPLLDNYFDPNYYLFKNCDDVILEDIITKEQYNLLEKKHQEVYQRYEVFHPRKYILADDNTSLVFLDFSQIELRVQAYYTILSGTPDYNLCRAYMPYDCISNMSWQPFNYTCKEHIIKWDSGEWINKDGTKWIPTDLHSATTKKAFPEIEENTPEFKKARYLGKMINFASVYGAGSRTLSIQLDVPIGVAEKLRNSYLSTFPGIAIYNKKVNATLALKGFAENLYGRRYYMESSNNYYKTSNYLIQGSCADSLKSIEILIYEYLKDKKSKFIMAIHDEVCISVADDETYVIKHIKELMENVADKIPYIPIVCEIEHTKTNWADKTSWKGI